ncbi:hypothetical protein ACHWQZ_G003088 [Mnemiopsis leidyi]
MSINVSNTTDSPGFWLKDEYSLPLLLVLIVTLLLSCLAMLSLVLSRCYETPHTIFYFNVSLLDAAMAFVGIFIVTVPRRSWGKDWVLSWILMLILLRQAWSLSVLVLTTIRYRMIQRKPVISLSTAGLLLGAVWLYSTTTTALWYLLTPAGLWQRLRGSICGIILQNLLVLSSCILIPAVFVLLALTSVKARRELSRITAGDMALSPSVSRDLNLIYSFGIIFLLGYGLLFVADVNSLINLGGVINVVPYWQQDVKMCKILGAADTVCNVLAGFSNSVILVRSRNVKQTLRRMYRANYRVVRDNEEEENILVEEDEEEEEKEEEDT